MDKSTLQLAAALSLGLGCGLLVGIVLGSRRRRLLLLNPAASLSAQQTRETSFEYVDGEYKMVLVVRNDLKMGKGKVAAQCSHAAVGAYKQMMKRDLRLLAVWEDHGHMKVVVKAPDEPSLLQAATEASRLGINTYIVRDAGRTQIAPGSKTVLCVGPGPESIIDRVTGEFKLY